MHLRCRYRSRCHLLLPPTVVSMATETAQVLLVAQSTATPMQQMLMHTCHQCLFDEVDM